MPDEADSVDIPHAPILISDIDSAPDALPVLSESNEQKFQRLSARIGELSSKNESLKIEVAELRSKAKTNRVLDKLIKPSAKKAFVFMCIYSGVVGVLLFLNGFKFWGFSLPESTLNYLVGSTAATVIGLVGMVFTGIFVGARK